MNQPDSDVTSAGAPTSQIAGYRSGDGVTWATEKRWDRCGRLVGSITHGGPNQYCIREKPCSDHAPLEHAKAEIKRLRAALDAVYPFLAGRVITLSEAGEENAVKSWNKACRIVMDALAPADNDSPAAPKP